MLKCRRIHYFYRELGKEREMRGKHGGMGFIYSIEIREFNAYLPSGFSQYHIDRSFVLINTYTLQVTKLLVDHCGSKFVNSQCSNVNIRVFRCWFVTIPLKKLKSVNNNCWLNMHEDDAMIKNGGTAYVE